MLTDATDRIAMQKHIVFDSPITIQRGKTALVCSSSSPSSVGRLSGLSRVTAGLTGLPGFELGRTGFVSLA